MKKRWICGAALVAAALAIPVTADVPKPFPEFSAKRIGPPKQNAPRLITIQIEPQPEPAPSPARAEPADRQDKQADPIGSYAWFWEAVSPRLSEPPVGRFETALEQIKNAPDGRGVRAPRISHLQAIIRNHGPEILTATIGTDVSPALALAVISVESSGKSHAVSSAGAQGLMQLIPATADRFGVSDSFDPAQNINGGVRYLNWLLAEFDFDPLLALAGYNAGEGAVIRHDGVPPYAETRDYVPKVLAAYDVARGLCRVPPELISDGCIFALN